MIRIRYTLAAVFLLSALTTADAQSVVLTPAHAEAAGVTVIRVGGHAALRSDGTEVRIEADRLALSAETSDRARAGTVIVEALDPTQDVRLQVIPAGAAVPITLVAARFTLTRADGETEWQVRGESRRAP